VIAGLVLSLFMSTQALAPQSFCFAPMVATADDPGDQDEHKPEPIRSEQYYNRKVGLFQMLVTFAHKWAGNGHPDRVLVVGDEPVLVDLIRERVRETYGLYWLPVESPHYVQALRAKMPFRPNSFRVVFSMEPITRDFKVTAYVIHQADMVLRTGGFYITDLANEFVDRLLVNRGYERLPYVFSDNESGERYYIFQKQRAGGDKGWKKIPIFYGDMSQLFKRSA
jgi:hypothetical protein